MTTPDVSGEWINGLKSKMTLKIINGKEVCGTYSTAVGNDDVVGESMKLRGTLHYPLITFFVDFTIVDSVGTWMGRFDKGINPESGQREDVLHTLWILGSLFQGSAPARQETKLWETFNINQSNFWRVRSAQP